MSIKSHKTTWPKFLLLSVVSIIGISVIHQEVKPISASASEETLLTSFSSNTLVTASTYQSYQDDNWLLTTGGNNNGIGASSSYASKLALGSYANLMSFDPSITSTSTYLTAVIAKTPFTHLSKISLSRGASNYAYSSTKAYLVKGSSLISDFSLVTTINEITTTLTDYTFPPITGDYYYALVFYNPNGTYLLGDMTINFYSTPISNIYKKVTLSDQLHFGTTYTFVEEISSNVIKNEVTPFGFCKESIMVSNFEFTMPNLGLSFILEVGETINSYLLKVNDFSQPSYLALDESNQFILSPTPSTLSSFHLSFDQGFVTLTSSSDLMMSFIDNMFTFATLPSNLSLYRLDQAVDYRLEATYFVDAVLTKGQNIKGSCESVYLYLDSIHCRLSQQAKDIITHSDEIDDVSAKERMNYLRTWSLVASPSTLQSFYQSKNTDILICLFILSAVVVASYVFMEPKIIKKK